MAKNIMKIKVQTLPNGYSLDVNGTSYMYFTEIGLLEGMLYHIGLMEMKYADQETIRDMLVAAIESHANFELAERVKKLEEAARDAEKAAEKEKKKEKKEKEEE
jgi:hypothetical protein